MIQIKVISNSSGSGPFYQKVFPLLIHLFKYVLSINYVLCSVQGTEVSSPCPRGISSLEG